MCEITTETASMIHLYNCPTQMWNTHSKEGVVRGGVRKGLSSRQLCQALEARLGTGMLY